MRHRHRGRQIHNKKPLMKAENWSNNPECGNRKGRQQKAASEENLYNNTV